MGSNAPEWMLPACRQTIAGPASPASRRREVLGVEPALLVDGDLLGRAEAQVAQGQHDRSVALGADEHPHPRCAGESVGRGVPARSLEHAVPRRGEAGEVRHRGAGDEADGGARGQPEQLQQPGRRDLLDADHARGGVAHAGVLVPGRDEPVGGQRGGQGRAHDPAEEPAGGVRHEAGLDGGGEPVDDLGGRAAVRRERGAEPGGGVVRGARRRAPGAPAPTRASGARARPLDRGSRRPPRQVPWPGGSSSRRSRTSQRHRARSGERRRAAGSEGSLTRAVSPRVDLAATWEWT